jgi:hypothetical protein
MRDGMPSNDPRRIGEGERPLLSVSLSRLSATLAATLALCSCGLETVTYFTAPSFVSLGSTLKLTHSIENTDSDFIGYDIFYRAYRDQSKASDDKSTIDNLIGQSTATPQSTLQQIKNLGFQMIRLSTNPSIDQLPLFRVTAKSTQVYYLISINLLNQAGDWYYTVSTDPSSSAGIGIVRSTESSFNSLYAATDKDYNGLAKDGTTADSSPSLSGDTVYFVFYAIAYGYDISKPTAGIYSMPASLSSETLASYTLAFSSP